VKKKKTITLVGVGVAGAALALSGTSALAGQGDAARGGGQILVGTEGGAGSTIAFTAEGTAETARGQVQYVDRSGEEQVVQHGTVTCIDVDGTVARIAGTWRDGGSFGLYVEDNGEGGNATSEDMIAVTPELEGCESDREEDDPTALARGNAQVRDAG
jgi:hypothetical protein